MGSCFFAGGQATFVERLLIDIYNQLCKGAATFAGRNVYTSNRRSVITRCKLQPNCDARVVRWP